MQRSSEVYRVAAFGFGALGLFVFLCLLYGTQLSSCLRYILYFMFFTVLPGYALLSVFSWPARWQERLVVSPVVGLCVEGLCSLLLKMIGLSVLTPCSPVLGLGLLLLRNRAPLEDPTPPVRVSPLLAAALSLTAVFLVIVLWAQFIRSPTFQDVNLAAVSVIAGFVDGNWPFLDYPMEGMRIAYCFMLHLHVAGAHAVTDISLLELGSRLVPFACTLSTLAAIAWVGQRRLRLGWWLVPLLLQLFVTVQPSDVLHKTLLHVVGPASFRSYTGLFAMGLFVVLYELYFSTRDSRKLGRTVLLAAILGAGLSGARPLALPVFLVALGCVGLWILLRERRLDTGVLCWGGCLGAVFLLGLHVFYGLGSHAGNLALVADKREVLSSSLLLPVLGKAGSAAVSWVGRFTFLAPGLLMILPRLPRLSFARETVFGIGALLASGLCILLINNPGGSEYKGLFYAHLAMALPAAAGMRMAVERMKRPDGAAALLAGAILLFVHVQDASTSFAASFRLNPGFLSPPALYSAPKQEQVANLLAQYMRPGRDYYYYVGNGRRVFRNLALVSKDFRPFYIYEYRLRLNQGNEVLSRRAAIAERLEEGNGNIGEIVADLKNELPAGSRVLLIWRLNEHPELTEAFKDDLVYRTSVLGAKIVESPAS